MALPNEDKRENSQGSSEELLEFQIAADASSEVDPTGLSDAQLLNRYGEALRRDMEASARSTGIQLSGPYKRRSDLIYGQKETLDFIFVSGAIPKSFEIIVDEAEQSSLMALHSEQITAKINLPTLSHGKSSSEPEPWEELMIRGRIQIPNTAGLIIVEPLSGEKLMAEPLVLQPEFLPFESSFAVLGKKLPSGAILLPQGSVDLLKRDPELARLRCELLNKQYRATEEKIGRLLEPKLLRGLLGQSKALKAKVVYPAQAAQ